MTWPERDQLLLLGILLLRQEGKVIDVHVGNETVEHVDKDLLVFLLGEDHLEVLVVKKIDELSAYMRNVFWFRLLS